MFVFAPHAAQARVRAGEMARLLAVLAARQQALPTAKAMRDGGTASVGEDAADRMVRLFAAHGTGRMAGAGAFNTATARYLMGTDQGEDGVYRGA